MAIANYTPTLTGLEIDYLKDCVDTGWVSSVGPYVDRLESDFAQYHNVKQAVAVSSGTAAIHLGLISLGVQPGDYVLVPTLTFIGSVNPVFYCGAKPIFLDAEHQTLNLCPQTLEEFLKTQTRLTAKGLVYKKDGKRISALLVVHLYGHPAKMAEILKLARKYHLKVLEDAAESLGAKYQGKLVGTFGDVGCFSFNGNKIVTTGGGGMLISKNARLTKLCKHLSTQAKKKDPFTFVHDHIGYNYRLSNLCAAVGVAQFQALDQFITQKRHQFSMYTKLIRSVTGWEIIKEQSGTCSTYWMVLARCTKPSKNIYQKVQALTQKGIGVRAVWHPMHKLALFKQSPYFGAKTAEQIYQTTFCLPSSVNLGEDDIKTVVDALATLSV